MWKAVPRPFNPDSRTFVDCGLYGFHRMPALVVHAWTGHVTNRGLITCIDNGLGQVRMLALDTIYSSAGIPTQQQQQVVQDCRTAWPQDTVVDLTAERD